MTLVRPARWVILPSLLENSLIKGVAVVIAIIIFSWGQALQLEPARAHPRSARAAAAAGAGRPARWPALDPCSMVSPDRYGPVDHRILQLCCSRGKH